MKEGQIDNYYKAYQKDQTMKENVSPSSYKDLFRFADSTDIIMMVIGTGLALGTGVSLIFYARPFGSLVDAFSNTDKQQIVRETLNSVYGFLQNSAIVFVLSWLSTTIWMVTSQRQMIKARKAYFASLLKQETAWHDRNKPTQICSRMYIQISKVHHALVNNITSVLTKVSLGFSGIIISLTRGWQMAVVMIGFLPLMTVAAFVSTYYFKQSQKYLSKSKAKIDSQVIQVFQSINTVRLLGGQNYEISRFENKINKVSQDLSSNAIKSKIAFAAFFFSILMNYALGFFYGAKLVSDNIYNTSTGQNYVASDVIVIFFTLYIANLSLSGLPQSFASFNISRISMKKIILIIDRQPRVKDGACSLPPKIDQIQFKHVMFRYEQPLFQNFNLTIKRGITALIGQSGNGKTTIVNLIMRFYDIFGGEINFISQGKAYNLITFKLQNLRKKIGYVGQQPVLIGKTIREVLCAEKLNEMEIKEILEKVEAWDFVQKIGIDNEFSSLSGGQKQRIAIARALVKKPQVLILDQGTSALDRRTQQTVLKALKKMGIPFVIMIAHRMQSIINADRIVKLDKGKIISEGNFQKLVKEGVLEQSILRHDSIESETRESNLKESSIVVIKNDHASEVIKIIEAAQRQNQPKMDHVAKDRQCQMNYITRLMKKKSQKWYLYLIGIFGACYIGAIFPIFALVLSNIVVIISGISNATNQTDRSYYQTQVANLSIGLFMISISSIFVVSLKGISFSILTESLGNYLKRKAFKVSINKPMPQVDQIGKQSLAHVINTNCDDLKELGGNHLGDIFQNLTTILVGLGLAFGYCWQITLVALGIFPLILISGKIQMSFNQGLSSKTDQVHMKTHQMVIDAVINHKTVKSCNIEDRIMAKYDQALDGALLLSIKNGNLVGIMFGLAQSLISTMLAIIFYIGALLINAGSANILNVYTAIYAIMFAGVQAGGNLAFLGKLAASKYAACNYFQLIQNQNFHSQEPNHARDSSCDLQMQNAETANEFSQGEIQFINLQFKYPKRQTPIFKSFNLKIGKGERVAIVGESGSGKSSLANLLFRIYDKNKGRILIDGRDIQTYKLQTLRTQLGIVAQQPVLFNRSIYENIKYNMDNVKFKDVVQAAKQANAYDFILESNFGLKQNQCEIPEMELLQISINGFQKSVGTKGCYLSGGQKQRIAIARAIVRKPLVIVLDEATSALDNANQKAVQEAIEKIKGITQIIIAHRLSTVEHCDRIVVMGQGRILEQGKYQQLLSTKGHFYNLVNATKKK